ncbi:2-keto-4-pentenoate hydratase/2-oxohepta-3-ene-1,7-dioic acid hydratase (catechol pathway) [Jannaschia seosinensis]|uniref:2-keto-4-pentenoate hydratase/2-oxohepta-3-ene-1,7-dioic acid hydratase (Catechol pathway) n=1 Tax=Jannaschia seosinensis TaxID=313367 RepID=A0A0M7BE30_9RHOB|nr:fumarylacetoacetate hydrolase family protein [Jannaschia seosinensis]CUH40449.1 2-keto-4-pentenoate hydratase/2-oxohepta-3-ene-1,7-dioic acid hydratase (catechol pathway) [Jannaschia seosinensis]
MILASYPDGRDGAACIVAPDRATARLLGRSFAEVIEGLVTTEGDVRPFDPQACTAPLPRARQFLDGSAYVNHVELVRRARGARMPESFWTDPLMYQGCADPFLGPTAPIKGDPDWGIDLEAEVAIVTGDVPMGADVDTARAAIRWVMLLNDVSLRNLIPPELAKGFGFVQSKPPSALAPLARSVDDVPGWDGDRLQARMCIDLNGQPFGRLDAGADMTFGFPQLIAHAAKTRPLPAGTVIGSGTVSNKLDGGAGRTIVSGGAGYGCIAEQRMVETIETGAPVTPFLRSGDHVEIWMEDSDGRDLFGRISQKVETL